jgi:hypothetical protein
MIDSQRLISDYQIQRSFFNSSEVLLLPYVIVDCKGYYSATEVSSNEGHHGIMDLPKLHIEDKRSNQQNQGTNYSYALADLRLNALACLLTSNILRLSESEGVSFQSLLATNVVPLSSRLGLLFLMSAQLDYQRSIAGSLLLFVIISTPISNNSSRLTTKLSRFENRPSSKLREKYQHGT